MYKHLACSRYLRNIIREIQKLMVVVVMVMVVM